MNNTTLKNRILWFDGDVTVDADTIEQCVGFTGVCVNQITPEIEEYNRFVEPTQKITIKHACRPLDFTWNLPSEYLTIDVYRYLFDNLEDLLVSHSDAEAKQRIKRILMELQLFEQFCLIPILQAIIYIINRLENNNVVWGVGRGSSVSSYILYVLGLHDVDSVEYDLDIRDFLKE